MYLIVDSHCMSCIIIVKYAGLRQRWPKVRKPIMTTAIEILEQQIEMLSATASEEKRKADVAAKNAETAQIQLRAIQDALRIIQKQVTPDAARQTPGVAMNPPEVLPHTGIEKLSASEAVAKYFETHSQATALDVVNALELQIQTTSTKPRQIIRNTLGAMVESGKLYREEDLYFPVRKSYPASLLSGLTLS